MYISRITKPNNKMTINPLRFLAATKDFSMSERGEYLTLLAESMLRPLTKEVVLSICTPSDRIKQWFTIENDIWKPVLPEAKKRIVKKVEFIPPSEAEFVAFFKKNGYLADIGKKAWRYYNFADPPWTDSQGKPVRDWKRKVQNNWFKDEYREIKSVKPKQNTPANYQKMHNFDV